MNDSPQCVAETREFPSKIDGKPERFEVWCSVHGFVCSYGTNTVRHFGVAEMQRQIDWQWLTHAATDGN